MRNELADKDAIRERIYLTTRAIDRADEAVFRTVYWPEAMHTGVGVTLAIEDFVAMALPSLRAFDTVSHTVGNVVIKVSGASAVAESSVLGYHRYDDNGRMRDNLQAGRYLDRFECRGTEWRIIERTVLIDWFREFEDSGDWSIGPMGVPAQRGGRHPDDPSYALFAQIG